MPVFGGRIRYRAEGEPHAPHYCHCRMRQRVVGAPVVAWVNLHSTKFAFTAAQPTFYQSSPGIRRGFCSNGGASICTIEDGDDYVCITIASSDEPVGDRARLPHLDREPAILARDRRRPLPPRALNSGCW